MRFQTKTPRFYSRLAFAHFTAAACSLVAPVNLWVPNLTASWKREFEDAHDALLQDTSTVKQAAVFTGKGQ